MIVESQWCRWHVCTTSTLEQSDCADRFVGLRWLVRSLRCFFGVVSVQGLVTVSERVIRIARGAMHMEKSASHPSLRSAESATSMRQV